MQPPILVNGLCAPTATITIRRIKETMNPTDCHIAKSKSTSVLNVAKVLFTARKKSDILNIVTSN